MKACVPGHEIVGIVDAVGTSATRQSHLFQERTLRSVTANTRHDGEEFLALAERMRIQVTTSPYALDQANLALHALAEGRVNGAAVLLAG